MIRASKPYEYEICDILDLAQNEFLFDLFAANSQDEKMRIFYQFYGKENTRFALENIFVYEINGKIVAACCAYGNFCDEPIYEYLKSKNSDYKIQKEFDEGEFYIDSIAILKDYRGQGILKKMLKFAENKAIKNGYKKLSLITKTPEYYQSFGFLITKNFILSNDIYKKMIKKL